ncbi:MAG: polyprenyl synthetase family protein [Thermoplasmata archaeon]|nr:polyprenyl synthetase family protein [Thermoplasmata archaeon]
MTSPAEAATHEPPFEILVSRAFGAEAFFELGDLLPELAEDLSGIEDRLKSVLQSGYPPLTEAVLYACTRGGKRLRPLLMAAAHRSLGATTTKPVHALAASFQLIHTASLIHDDVIDHADQRRGRPSVLRAFGLPTAIVAGDYLYVRAFELASEYPQAIILRCGEACASLAEGEILQEACRFDLTISRDQYLGIVTRKTATIVSAALASVGDIAGSTASIVEALAAYGRAVGIAFQLRDDLLDAYGEPDLLGKPLYADFREGNPTLLSIEAYQHLDGRAKTEYERLFARHEKRPRELHKLRTLTDQTPASAIVSAEGDRWASAAIRALDPLPHGPYRSLLERLARAATTRRY